MNSLITAILLLSASMLHAEETASEVAKRVIADKSPALDPKEDPAWMWAFTPIDGCHTPKLGKPHRTKALQELEKPMKKSQDTIDSYMLGDEVPEQMRLTYALAILSSKTDQVHSKWLEVQKTHGRHCANQIGLNKFDTYLKDAQILADRLQEIEKAEHAEEK